MLRSFVAMAAAMMLPAATVHAAPVTFEFNAGPILYLDDFPDTPPEIAAFMVGEDVLIQYAMDSSVADQDPTAGRGYYEDPFADVTLTGTISGAVITMTEIGAIIEVDSAREIDFNTYWLVSDLDPFGIADEVGSDIDIGFEADQFSNPDDLATTLAEFTALLDPSGVLIPRNTATSSTATLAFWLDDPFSSDPEDGMYIEEGIIFGPVPVTVPIPPAAPLLAAGVMLLALRRRLG